MALFNEILVGRYNRFLQKLMAMKGGPPSAQLASEIQPNISFFSGVENRILESWQRFALTLNQAAVAAQTNGLQLRNPNNSNVIAVIEQSTFLSNVNSDTFTLNLSNQGNPADLGAGGQGLRLDSRLLLSSTCIGSGNGASPGQIGTTIKLISLQNSVMYQDILMEDQELILTPGDALRMTNAVVNATTRWGLIWRERFLEDSERVG
jgi:hypothetical protein